MMIGNWITVPITKDKFYSEINFGFEKISKALDQVHYVPYSCYKEIISDLETNYRINCSRYDPDSADYIGECNITINKKYSETKKENEYKLLDYIESIEE